MKEVKAKLSDLFKNGENFKLREVDYSSKRKVKEIEAIEKIREENRKKSSAPPLNDPFWRTPFTI